MIATVLLIVFDGRESITVHEDEAAAWAELMRFVDSRWHERFADRAIAVGDEEVRAKMLFGPDDGDHYILASADLTELERLVD